MASSSSPSTAIAIATLIFMAQCPALPQAQPLDTTLAKCQPLLLLLVSCMPFVQGFLPVPADECCDNLDDVYDKNPECLCLLIDGNSSASPFPINHALAMQLPRLCGVSVDMTRCRSGPDTPPPPLAPPPTMPPIIAPNSTNSTLPVVASAPRTGGFFFGVTSGGKKRVKGLPFLVLATVSLLTAIASC